MVAAEHAEEKPAASNKRKRSSNVSEQKKPKIALKVCSDLLVTFADEERAQATLDYTDDARPRSIRQRLESEDYPKLETLLQHLTYTRDNLLRQTSDPGISSNINSLHREILDLIVPKKPQEATGDEAQDTGKDGTTAFPERPAGSQTLFASTIVGPLFTASTQPLPDNLQADLPPNIQSISVLPTAPSEGRCLEDLYQLPTKLPLRDTLSAARQPIYTSKSVKRGTYETFGLDRDAQGALLDRETVNMYLSYRQDKKAESNLEDKSKPEENKLNGAEHMDTDHFTFDDDLLEVFDSEERRSEDVSALLLQLSEMQRARLVEGPFSSPSDEEQALADKISNKLSAVIATNDIKPKQLLPKGIKSDYMFARYGPSYTGTLPPTIGQAVRATYAHSTSLQGSPLSRTRSQVYPKFNPANSLNSLKSQSTSSTTHTTKAATPVPP